MIIEPDTQRKYTRIHLDRHVNVEFVSDSYEYRRVKNLSLAGMFAVGDFNQHVGRSCNVDLVPTGKESDVSLQALARVVRKNDEGIALEFTSMPLDSYLFLQTTFFNESKDPFVNEKIVSEDCPFEVIDDFPTFPRSYVFPKVI